ncbi:MAG TPA: protein kinase [Acidobacteriaceae bacterium]|jgi:serine/threonine protein kinase
MNLKEFRERYEYDAQGDLVGAGGFGRVYKARDIVLDRTVALKIFSRDVPQQYDLISEIKRAIDLNHPNICRYRGAEVLKGTNALGEAQEIQVGIMEFIEGGTISHFLRENPQYRQKLLTDVLRGLSYLHQRHPPIIHRDLKPSNVLVGRDDGVPVARITDFGISKSSGVSGAGASTMAVGTCAYMAPEQFNPVRFGVNGKIQCNLDLWSFGVMTIELLTGALPFGADDPEASTGQIIESITRGLSPGAMSGIGEPYRSVLSRCMMQDARQRAESADELISLMNAGTEAPVVLAPRPVKPIRTPALTEKIEFARPRAETQFELKPRQPSQEVPEKHKDAEKAGIRPWRALSLWLLTLALYGLGVWLFVHAAIGFVASRPKPTPPPVQVEIPRPASGGFFMTAYPLNRPDLSESVAFNPWSPGKFREYGRSILTGRDLFKGDDAGGTPAAVINDAGAHRWWPGGDALGRLVRAGDRDWMIVGIVSDPKPGGQQANPTGAAGAGGIDLFVPAAQLHRPARAGAGNLHGAEAGRREPEPTLPSSGPTPDGPN